MIGLFVVLIFLIGVVGVSVDSSMIIFLLILKRMLSKVFVLLFEVVIKVMVIVISKVVSIF